MAERGKALAHLARGLEELLRAGAETLALLQERADERGARPPSPLEQTLRRCAEQASTWVARGESEALHALRVALRRERMRWEYRADSDPAAARLRDLLAALLDVVDAEPEPEAEAAGGAEPETSARASETAPRRRAD